MFESVAGIGNIFLTTGGTKMKIRAITIAALFSAGVVALPLTTYADQGVDTSAAVATAPGMAMAVKTSKVTATVVGINKDTREVTLKRSDGKIVIINATEEVRNFDQIRVGDKVKAEYTQSLTLELKKGGKGKPGVSGESAMARAPLGAKPAGAVGREVTILANVVAVNAKKHTVTLRGPQGNTVDLLVQDPNQLKNIKKGDQVEAVYTESLAVALEAAPKKATKKSGKK
jgi:Cu/Ag efflux protein CusF